MEIWVQFSSSSSGVPDISNQRVVMDDCKNQSGIFLIPACVRVRVCVCVSGRVVFDSASSPIRTDSSTAFADSDMGQANVSHHPKQSHVQIEDVSKPRHSSKPCHPSKPSQELNLCSCHVKPNHPSHRSESTRVKRVKRVLPTNSR